MLDGGAGIHIDRVRASALMQRSCDHGDAPACGYLAYWAAPRGDAERMVSLAKRACSGGNALGCQLLEHVTRHGVAGVKVDLREADALRRRRDELASAGCNNGDSDACFILEGRQAQAKKALERQCARRDPLACGELALRMSQEIPGGEISTEALHALDHACELGVGFACGRAGTAYGLRGDEELALVRSRRGCELGDYLSCSSVASELHSRDDAAGAQTAERREARLLEGECKAFDSLACSFAALAAKRRGDAKAQARFEARALETSRSSCKLLGNFCAAAANDLLEMQPPRVEDAFALLEIGCRVDGICDTMAKAHIKHGNEEQRRRAVEALARSCEQGASLTCEDLSELLETTEPERATVFKRQAVTLWTAGCDRGDASDCMSAARAYGEGKLVERDADLEKRFAKRACELGHVLCKMMEP